jgi:polyisoprenoid-binding protein YceI
MDEVMYENMKVQQFPRITFKLEELTLKEAAKAKEDPYKFEAKGDLAVAGVTNKITMPVSITPLGDKKLKINGTAAVKMTDFKIQPPAPKIALGMIKTGDDVKLIFEWMVGPKPASAAK